MQDKPSPTAEGSEIGDDNLSFEDLTNLLSKGPQPEQAEESPEEAEQSEEQEEEVESEQSEEADESETEEGEEESEEDEAESDEIDLLSLEPEQLKALAKKSKSRLLERVGELSAKNKALQSQLEQAVTQQPQVKTIPQEQNPFGHLNTPEAVQAEYSKLEQTMETTDRLLDEYEDYAPDDIIDVQGQQFTKKQIKTANRNAREAIAKYLPAQAAHLQKLESYKVANQQWQAAAVEEVPEIADEKSEVGRRYKELVSDPLVQQLKEKQPELGVQIEYILAHAARSKFGQVKKVAQGAGKKLKVKPPASPVGAGSQRVTTGTNSKYAEAMKRFEQTGSVDDWVSAQKYKTN